MRDRESKSIYQLLKTQFVWDCWVHKEVRGNHNPLYHIYHLQAPRWREDGSVYETEERHHFASVGHITAGDLFDQSTWEYHGTCLHPDTENDSSPHSLAIWTGSMMSIDEANLQQALGASYIMALTGRSKKDHGRVQRLWFAVSEDAYNWAILRDHKGQIRELDLSIIPDQAYGWAIEGEDNNPVEVFHCRDPKIMPYPGREGEYLMLFTSHRADKEDKPFTNGCIGAAISNDLVNWEILPPLNTPKLLGKMEVPQLVNQGNDWYLLISCETNVENKELLDSLNVPYNSGGYVFKLKSRNDEKTGYLDLGGSWEYFDYWGGSASQEGLPALYAPTVADVIEIDYSTKEVVILAWHGYTKKSDYGEFEGGYKVYKVKLS